CYVVDDAESDAVIVHPCRDLEILLRGFEPTRRMIVDEHLAPGGEPGQCEHAPHVAARDDARRLQHTRVVRRANETHLAATGEPDGGANSGCGGWREARIALNAVRRRGKRHVENLVD